MTEYVLYGGKGGVGKTTCAAATGLALANRGERTLVVSTDPAHSLGDAYGVDLDGDPSRVGGVEGDLWGVEADPESGQETYRRVVKALAADFREAGVRLDAEDVDRLFSSGFVPGSDEVAALEYFGQFDGDWDRVVFDTAPTGHTLRLLTLPDVLQESLSTAAKVQSEVGRLVDSARSMVVGPAAFLGGGDDESEVEAFREQMAEVASLVRDPDRTEFRVVLLPETLSIEETRRLVERLESFEVPVGSLLVNRVLESSPEGCERCRTTGASHEERIRRVRDLFSDTDVRTLPDVGPEVGGREELEELADQIRV